MKQLAGTSYNLLVGFPTGTSRQAQAEFVLNTSEVMYDIEGKRSLKIKSVRFLTESEQLRDLSNELLKLAEALDALQKTLQKDEDEEVDDDI